MVRYVLAISTAWLALNNAVAQLPAFYSEVQQFKTADSMAFPAKNQVLFAGSSSFTLWQDAPQYFRGYQILNRAFGGSTLADQIYYRYDIYYAYQPKQLVLYCGENDFAYSDTISVNTVVNRFTTLYKLIRQKYPGLPIVYVAMKPSPARRHLMPKFKAANLQIAAYLRKQKNTGFVDVYHAMLVNGEPNGKLFGPDSLHMTKNGYQLWQQLIQPFLKK
jgi:lysophospholipase L1-like esterase